MNTEFYDLQSRRDLQFREAAGRRGLLRKVGYGIAGSAVLAATSTAGLALSTTPAEAASTDTPILNFALNLEYLEAEYYLRAVTGQGISAALTGGVPANTVTGGSLVPFQNAAIAYFAQDIANDELAHVTFLRTVLGASAVAEPVIDLVNSFNTLAVAAGLIVPGQTFNPFASELNFLIGAYVFEDVGVTAYAGAASSLSAASLPYAASILGTEAYHAGAIRGRLAEIGGQATTNAISILRSRLSGVTDFGLNAYGNAFRFSNVDTNGQVFRRTPAQVLSIVYGGGATGGLFFPNGINAGPTS